MQVDLFFYRDPEEAKEQEEAEAPVAIDHVPGGDFAGTTDNWTDLAAAAPPVSSVPTADWNAAQGQLFPTVDFFRFTKLLTDCFYY